MNCKELTNEQQCVCPRGAGTEPPVREIVAHSKGGQPTQRVDQLEKDRQSNSKAFHLTVDFNHAFFPTLEKAKRTAMLCTMNYQRNPLFMM